MCALVDLCCPDRAGAGRCGDRPVGHDGLTRVDRPRSIHFLDRLGKRDLPLLATIALALVNGLDVSPAFDSVSFWLYPFARGSALFDGEVFFYLTSLAISAMTLLLAGIPAALYERGRGLAQSTPGSLAIWLAATLLLTLPTILRALALGED